MSGQENEIMVLAEQAGMYYREIEDEFCKADTDGVPMKMLEAFANLVAARTRKEMANEFAGLGEWTCVHIIEAIDS